MTRKNLKKIFILLLDLRRPMSERENEIISKYMITRIDENNENLKT
jgi:hypothetical protein